MTDTTAGLILALLGVFAMVGSSLNWRIVTHSGKLFNMLFGDRIARIIYFAVGLFIFVLGMGQIFGLHWLES
jgi:hypothetical protein